VRASTALLLLPLCAACTGQKAPLGLTEPIRVENAQFISGDLPGTPPITDAQSDAGVVAADPTVTFFETQNRIIPQGESEKRLDGRTSPDAVAVGIRFADIGTGYWVIPTGAPDPQNQGELVWSATCDFARDLPPGLHNLRFAAIDGNGGSGTEEGIDMCLLPPYPDNYNACDPTIVPPAVVVSLAWDVGADLDLRLKLPDGTIIDPKTPSNAEAPDGGTSSAKPDPTKGVLDRDSNAGCVLDGQNREDVSFQKRPPAGTYQIYANLFDACGTTDVHFTASLYLSQSSADGKKHSMSQVLTKSGEILASQANGGAGTGLFVAEFNLE
jgi:hypothetical protein